jgi:hypothetical protein
MGSQANRLMSCFFQGCCFAPDGGAPAYWTVQASPGELGSRKHTAGSSAWHLVHGTFLLFPVGTLDHGTGKQEAVGEVQPCPLSDSRAGGQQRQVRLTTAVQTAWRAVDSFCQGGMVCV